MTLCESQLNHQIKQLRNSSAPMTRSQCQGHSVKVTVTRSQCQGHSVKVTVSRSWFMLLWCLCLVFILAGFVSCSNLLGAWWGLWHLFDEERWYKTAHTINLGDKNNNVTY